MTEQCNTGTALERPVGKLGERVTFKPLYLALQTGLISTLQARKKNLKTYKDISNYVEKQSKLSVVS